MRQMLKTLSLVTVIAMIAAMVLSGCTTPTPVPTVAPTSAPAGQTEAAAATPAPEPTIDTSKEVHLYGYLLGAALPGMPDVMDALNAKLKKDINATMEVNYLGWSDYQSKYPLILAAGENVDWIYTAAWCMYPQQAAKGAFLEITPDILAKYMPLHWAMLKDTTSLKESSINGKDYMITTATPDKKVPVVIYRKDLATKYGIGDIKRFADIEPYLAAIKANEPNMVPMNLDSTYDLGMPHGDLLAENSGLYIDILYNTSNGCGLVYKQLDTDKSLHEFANDPAMLPAYISAAKTMKSWYEAGYINKDAFANKVRSKESFVSGKSAVAFGNSIDIQGNITAATAAGFDVGIIPILTKDGKNVANAFTNNGVAISAKSKNWERALMALDLIMEDESYDNLCYYGVEGKHYILTADKKIDYTGIDQNAYPIDQAGFWFVNKDLFKPQTSWTPGYIDLQNKIAGYLDTDSIAAFIPNTDKIKTEAANCNNVLVQYNNPIVLGAVTDVEAAYKTLADQLNAAGIGKIMTELTTQINAYISGQ
jgi:putative aldouronate transport system substrate-binding protein